MLNTFLDARIVSDINDKQSNTIRQFPGECAVDFQDF